MKIEYVKKCQSCQGTGVYVGFGEKDGFGIVCHTCKGTGKVHVKIEYEEFIERGVKKDIHTILEFNPGIGIGLDKKKGLEADSFGGDAYATWLRTGVFPPKSEMRNFSCPAWWYQGVDYDKKPSWDECIGCGTFSSCSSFKAKEQCWEKFDKQHKT